MKPKILLFDLDQTLLASRKLPLKMHFILRGISLLRKRGMGLGMAYRFLGEMHRVLETGSTETTNAVRVGETLRGLYPHLTSEESTRWIEEWVTEVFSELYTYFTPMKESEDLFFELKAQSQFRFVLATNPVWPIKVTLKRLSRGRLRPEHFEWITAAEQLHFIKPHINYYREVLEHLKVEPQDCLMIGDSFHKDAVAADLGIPTFILSHQNRDHSPLLSEGKLETLRARLL